MLRQLLPLPVKAAELWADRTDPVHPEEQAVVARAVPARQQEFLSGRWCARSALADLGVASGPLLKAPGGAPLWPAGVVGSITHCRGYRAAAVARRSEIQGIGIDAEPNEALPAGVLPLVASPSEIAHLEQRRQVAASIAWDRLLFSVKEAVYKAEVWVETRWLDFTDVEVHLGASRFMATLKAADGRPYTRAGKWGVANGILLSALTLPGAPASST